MQYLVNNNVGYLVSLTAERCPDIQGYEKDLHLTCIKIVDFTPPTLQQTEVFLQMMEKARKNKKAVAIHCAHGKGRTGTMAACYLIKQYGYTTRQAIDKIRQIRPGSIETKDQELFVHQFEEYQNTR
ncbi:hypothetical protein SNE40_012194 [Patella caerulea]|uniref:Dual specificity protein phosphatase 23 n=1 Tax=Patella caerulea TaxID=87958 RepID=A0AAN8JPW0_PATCE